MNGKITPKPLVQKLGTTSDLTDCRSLAKMKAREEFPELLMVSPMEFDPNYISVKDVNLEKYRWARIQHEKECMVEKGYYIE